MALLPSLAPSPNAASPLVFSRQLILVVARDWESTTARLLRFERDARHSGWRPVGDPVKVSLGRNGLAWGIGLHRDAGDGPSKREGDGRAPAGIFAITGLFGYGDLESPVARSARLPYRRATPDLKCIDDPASRHYNCVVDRSCLVDIDWQSHEDMLRHDERYAMGAVIAHNSDPPVPGAGSCIFLHVWEREGVPTAGCTAASLADITDICLWLDRAAAPLFVLLPRRKYEFFKDAWALPAFPG